MAGEASSLEVASAWGVGVVLVAVSALAGEGFLVWVAVLASASGSDSVAPAKCAGYAWSAGKATAPARRVGKAWFRR